MIMTAQSLLNQNLDPTDEDIRNALGANLCRCGTHTRIIKAVKRAANEGVTA
jgi:nicotinate dehydrogenase subunit A